MTINVRITLFVFLPLVGIVAVVQQAQKRIKQYRRASRLATEQVTGVVGEMFSAVQAIKVAGAQHDVIDHFRRVNEQRRQLMLRDRLFTAILNSAFENLVSIGTGGILLFASTSMHSGTGKLTVGDLALFVYYLAFVTEFLSFFGNFLAVSKHTEVSFERMSALLSGTAAQTLVAHNPLYLNDLRGRQQELPTVEQPLWDEGDRATGTLCDRLQELTASNLTYHYPNTGRGIRGVNLKLTRGSLTVITGRIGSGKTTLLRVLLGLLPLQAGAIYWNGSKVDDPANFFVPPRSAYTAQVPQLFSYSLKENILLGLDTPEIDLTKALHMSVFDIDVATMSDGLETVVGPKGVRLSGGQLQRAAAARMLVRQPELLVFDDLSSALDVETEQKLWSRLFAARSVPDSEDPTATDWTPTCLVVSHRHPVLQRADQIIVLSEGRVEAQGNLVDLLDNCAEMQRIWQTN